MRKKRVSIQPGIRPARNGAGSEHLPLTNTATGQHSHTSIGSIGTGCSMGRDIRMRHTHPALGVALLDAGRSLGRWAGWEQDRYL